MGRSHPARPCWREEKKSRKRHVRPVFIFATAMKKPEKKLAFLYLFLYLFFFFVFLSDA